MIEINTELAKECLDFIAFIFVTPEILRDRIKKWREARSNEVNQESILNPTIAALEAEKIEYILGVRERTSREVRAEIDRAKVEADARFDGLFVLRTNTKIAALQVVLRYRNLLAVPSSPSSCARS
jgi:hypothetical protein